MIGIEARDAAAGVRTCTQCGFAGPYLEFPRNGRGGRRKTCKKCYAEYSRKYTLEHKEQVAKSQSEFRKRNRHKLRIAERNWRDKNRDLVNAKAARSYERNKEKMLAKNLEWRNNHRLHIKCRDAVKHEVLSGRMEKPLVCQKCGLEKKLDGHHEDYSKPLSVVWLCRKCHRLVHDGKSEDTQ